jgi:hypothetical protein
MRDYYMLECVAPDDWEDNALIPGLPPPPGEGSWHFGRRFASAPANPMLIELDAEYGIQINEFDNTDALLITKRLHKALTEAGVTNLDAYPTLIRHTARNFETTDYLACNIVGIVAAVNLAASKVSGGSADSLIDVDFESVTLDPTRIGGLLMFRLVENTSAVVIHRSVGSHS